MVQTAGGKGPDRKVLLEVRDLQEEVRPARNGRRLWKEKARNI